MGVAQSAKTFVFGDDNSLIGTITDPAAEGASKVAVILWGMGVAEMRAARSLAKLGLVAMQIRQNGDDPNDILDAAGVLRCQQAMAALKARRGSEQFILVGNCAVGSVSFNAALADSHVVGVVVTNPYVSQLLSLNVIYRRKLGRADKWRRLLSGKARIGLHLANLRWLGASLLGRLLRVEAKTLVGKHRYRRDLILPTDLGKSLGDLGARGVRTLLVFSRDDPALDYFQNIFGESLAGLRDVANLRVELLAQGSHVISQDDEAASRTSDLITDWAARAGFGAAPAPVGISAPRQSPRLRGAETIEPDGEPCARLL